MSTLKRTPSSKFADVSFEFTENGVNVVEHHLVQGLKDQPWKHFMTPDIAASVIIDIKCKGGVLYAEQGGRGGF
jgi:hypothetical protein